MINKLYQNKVLNKYTRIKKIGKGNFGDVWLVEDGKGKVLWWKKLAICFEKNWIIVLNCRSAQWSSFIEGSQTPKYHKVFWIICAQRKAMHNYGICRKL